MVCYGEEGVHFQALLLNQLGDIPLVYAQRFDEAVTRARALAQRGDVVVLSPAATSYDQFATYTERGERFIQLVHQLESVKRQTSSVKQESNG